MTTITSNISQQVITEPLVNTAITETELDETSAEVATTEQESVEISTRAQKIQKLNEEFFSSGSGSFKVTEEFIERLQEFGFLSVAEADKISVNASLSSTSETDEGTDTLKELSLFIDSFTDSVEAVAPDSPLLSLFDQIQIVLDNFNDPTEESLAIDISSLSEQFKSYNESSTSLLTESDQKSLDQIELALSLANVLTPGMSTSTQINQYLEVYSL